MLLILLIFNLSVNALTLEDYLPKDTRYDTSIPTPKAVTGTEVGERHFRHDQIVHYLSVIAASSSRARLVDYGTTNEGRRLVLLFISSDKNMENLEALTAKKDLLKVWNGFSVHGNEASGANASVLYAYHLAAGHSDEIDNILNETLVIIDPTINPDGYDRFVTDVNSMRGQIDNPDSNDASHREQNPNGRTNHYWFDLNRDWLLLTQKESQARLKQFHKWQPHVLDDHHEMGSNKTFFFQPGVPERTNPLIPQKNIDLTTQLGQFHAKTLTEKGAPFFTQESYDDFYPGKGSTYPDLQGSIGILFEQASARGGKLKTSEGMRTLQTGIDNQFRTAVSTLKGAYSLKTELLNYKQDFFKNARTAANSENFSGYVLDFSGDAIKGQKMADYLSIHKIKVEMLKNDVRIGKKTYKAHTALYIPIIQNQYTLIKSLFNTDTHFKDNTFYDVSAWNIGMAWGIDYARVKTTPDTEAIQWPKAHNSYNKNALAYAFNWQDGNAPAALYYLQTHGLLTKVASKGFSVKDNGNDIHFSPGTLIIPTTNNDNEKVMQALSDMSTFFQVSSIALTTGLNEQGIDLGSPAITTLKQPKALLLMGEGVNSYQAGSIWHLFDTSIGLPLTKIRKSQLKNMELEKYTHLIMPSGNYNSLTEKTTDKINNWVKHGGQLIAFQKSAQWVEKNIQKLTPTDDTEIKVENKPYADFENDLAKNTIGGAIISAHADLTHPLGFGMKHTTQHLLLKGNAFLQASKNAYSTPLKATDNALAAGYISEKKLKQINKASMLIAERLGQGTVIKFGFNPTFRGFWLGTQNWLVNAVFFSSLIEKTELPK